MERYTKKSRQQKKPRYIFVLSNGRTTVHTVHKDTTVGTLAADISAKIGIPAMEQRLHFQSKIVDLTKPTQLLRAYSIRNGSTVNLLLRIKGGMKVVIKSKIKGWKNDITVDTDSFKTVKKLKALVHKQESCYVKHQSITYNGKVLTDDEELREIVNAENGHTLYVHWPQHCYKCGSLDHIRQNCCAGKRAYGKMEQAEYPIVDFCLHSFCQGKTHVRFDHLIGLANQSGVSIDLDTAIRNLGQKPELHKYLGCAKALVNEESFMFVSIKSVFNVLTMVHPCVQYFHQHTILWKFFEEEHKTPGFINRHLEGEDRSYTDLLRLVKDLELQPRFSLENQSSPFLEYDPMKRPKSDPNLKIGGKNEEGDADEDEARRTKDRSKSAPPMPKLPVTSFPSSTTSRTTPFSQSTVTADEMEVDCEDEDTVLPKKKKSKTSASSTKRSKKSSTNYGTSTKSKEPNVPPSSSSLTTAENTHLEASSLSHTDYFYESLRRDSATYKQNLQPYMEPLDCPFCNSKGSVRPVPEGSFTYQCSQCPANVRKLNFRRVTFFQLRLCSDETHYYTKNYVSTLDLCGISGFCQGCTMYKKSKALKSPSLMSEVEHIEKLQAQEKLDLQKKTYDLIKQKKAILAEQKQKALEYKRKLKAQAEAEDLEMAARKRSAEEAQTAAVRAALQEERRRREQLQEHCTHEKFHSVTNLGTPGSYRTICSECGKNITAEHLGLN
jgi:hypothetical protein